MRTHRIGFVLSVAGLLSLAAAAHGAGTAPRGATDSPQKIELGEMKMLDVHGQAHALGHHDGRPGTVFVFLSTECPISRQYVPELNRLAETARSSKLAFYGVLADRSVTQSAARKFADEFHIAFPVLFDGSQELAELLRPQYVPEARLIDAAGAVRYRGRIDDLYADVDKRRNAPSRRDLAEAMTALATGRAIAVPRTEPVGCPFEAKSDAAKSPVTYTRDIAPILFAHCVECHRPGEVAPFSLLTYQDAAKRAQGLVRATERRLMPPWKADIHYGQFLDERRLTERQIALVKTWAAGGAPQGDAADLPPAPKFAAGWRLGTPDVVAQVPVKYTVPADGPDVFQHFVIPIKLAKDETIVGFEFRPTNPAVVHHAVLFLDTSGGSRARDAQTPEPGWKTSGSIDASITGVLGVWTPGMTPRFYPNDVGVTLDKGADLVVQLHLHPSGKVETDQSKIALFFAKKPVKNVMSRSPLLLGSLAIEIPPGTNEYKVASSVTVPVDVSLTSVFPHMHLIGRSMKVTATLPDKTVRPLIWIKDWSFYWQDSYVYREPVHLPKGTRVDIEAVYDNSSTNPFNPSSPPKRVLFGNGTTDEMCFAIFQTVAEEPGSGGPMRKALMRSMMDQWNKAKLSPDGRARIMIEAMKLFGNRRPRRPPAPAAAQASKG